MKKYSSQYPLISKLSFLAICALNILVPYNSHAATNPCLKDTDRDGVVDCLESQLGFNSRKYDTGDTGKDDGDKIGPYNVKYYIQILRGIVDVNKNNINDCGERHLGAEPYEEDLSAHIARKESLDIKGYWEPICKTKTQRNCKYSCRALRDTSSRRCKKRTSNPGTTPTSTPVPGTTGTPNSTTPTPSTPTTPPSGSTPTPTTPQNTPTRTPTPTPAGSCPNGTTTSFGIPSGISGRVASGQTLWSSKCAVCHSSLKLNRTYQQVQASLALPVMTTVSNLTTQQVADLTAYLNCH